jgi:hypothetical protein
MIGIVTMALAAATLRCGFTADERGEQEQG